MHQHLVELIVTSLSPGKRKFWLLAARKVQKKTKCRRAVFEGWEAPVMSTNPKVLAIPSSNGFTFGLRYRAACEHVQFVRTTRQQGVSMPTYNCFSSSEKLATLQKKEIAEWLTKVYQEEFGLERYMTQVIFNEVAKDDRYIAGKPARPDLIWIRCDVRAGRNKDMKARLLRRIQQGVAQTASVPEEAVWVYFCDLPPEDIMEWGHIMPPLRAMPDDDTWFKELSGPFKEYLRRLAA
jgi:phenylpyruvate tautomerase PptA (4-oxalocrotonate tautomerase family)